jgi:hypothetical protein
MHRLVRVAALCVVLTLGTVATSAAQSSDVDFGGMILTVSDSRTAQLFHIVDQLSQWDQYAHHQYVRWARTHLVLTAADSVMLRRHAALRRARGWGNGFEQAFLVDAPIEVAAQQAVDSHLLSEAESAEEEEILLHFAPKLEPLCEQESARIAAFRQQLVADRARLTPVVERLARFAGATTSLRVPVFLVANPEETSGGGEANGGRLVIEVPSPAPMGFLLHEALHAFLSPHADAIRAAADSAGLHFETLNEAIAYALAPGITGDARQNDLLAEQLAHFVLQGRPKSDPYMQFYLMAIVIRPVLRAALERGGSFSAFLPQAIAQWRRAAPP